MREPQPKKTRLTVYLPDDLHLAIQHEAVERRMTLSDLILEALMSRVVRIHETNRPK